jgi:hypothetical protein
VNSDVFGIQKKLAEDFQKKGIDSFKRGDHKESLEYYQKALAIRIKLFGENHADVA